MSPRAFFVFLLVVLCLGAAAQSPPSAPPAQTPNDDVEVYTVSTPDRGVTAHFMGVKFAPDAALPFGVRRLQFTFAGDPKPYEFKTDGEFAFVDWNTKIFSPSYDWVVLLRGYHGPFVIVSTRRLRDYLAGNARPDRVLSADDYLKVPDKGNEREYRFLQWTSYDGFLFSASCCGRELQFDYQIPDKKYSLIATVPRQ